MTPMPHCTALGHCSALHPHRLRTRGQFCHWNQLAACLLAAMCLCLVARHQFGAMNGGNEVVCRSLMFLCLVQGRMCGASWCIIHWEACKIHPRGWHGCPCG